MITRLTRISIVVAAGIPTLGFALADRPIPAGLSALVGLIWLLAHRRGIEWITSSAFALCVAAAAGGARLAGGTVWAVPGVVAALWAWDLSHFTLRLAGHPVGEETRPLELRHLSRLALVSAVGLLLGWVALQSQAFLSGGREIGLGLAIFLGFLAMLGLSQAIRLLGRESA